MIFCLFRSHSQQSVISYEGSSTIAHFIEDAKTHYTKAKFNIFTESESSGGEKSIIEGNADIAGVARIPSPKVLGKGVISTLIGWDAIAIIVHGDIPIDNLTKAQIKDIFTNRITNWNQLGGPDLIIRPFIVNEQSATHKVFRSTILGQEDYINCQKVAIDKEIISKVADIPGSIGQISFSFLNAQSKSKTIAVDGQEATVENQSYPITRPLYLLWWPGRKDVSDFVEWTQTQDAQSLIQKRFIGKVQSNTRNTGKLVVYTKTKAVEDGGAYYYPHEPYEIYNNENVLIQRIANHLDLLDENPTHVSLLPGKYLIWTYTDKNNNGEKMLVTVESNNTTTVQTTNQAPPQALQNTKSAYNNLKLYGDFRFRGEQDWNSIRRDGSLRDDRGRLRYRLRVGFNYQSNQHLTIGARVRSGVGDNRQSPHITLGQNENHSIVIDKAFVKFTKNNYSLWAGKNNFPFWKQNELVWDDDVTPEGLAFSGHNTLHKNTKLKYNFGYFIINSKGQNLQDDPSLIGAQLVLETQVSNFKITAGTSYLGFDKITDKNDLGGNHILDYDLSVSCLSLTYDYKTPISIGIDYIKNLTSYDQDTTITKASLQDEKTGFVTNLKIGSIDKKGNFLLAYYYAHIPKYAIVDFLAQDDWVRWDLDNASGTRSSNFKGHEIRLSYAIKKDMNIVIRSYFTKAIAKEGISQTALETNNRFRADFNLKF